MNVELYRFLVSVVPFNIVITGIFIAECDIPKNPLIRISILVGSFTPIPMIVTVCIILYRGVCKLFSWIGGKDE
jgi:hypothetical protein